VPGGAAPAFPSFQKGVASKRATPGSRKSQAGMRASRNVINRISTAYARSVLTPLLFYDTTKNKSCESEK